MKTNKIKVLFQLFTIHPLQITTYLLELRFQMKILDRKFGINIQNNF